MGFWSGFSKAVTGASGPWGWAAMGAQLGLSLLLSPFLKPKPPEPERVESTVKGTVQPAKWILGRRRTEPTVVWGSLRGKRQLALAALVSEDSCDAIEKVWIRGEEMPFDRNDGDLTPQWETPFHVEYDTPRLDLSEVKPQFRYQVIQEAKKAMDAGEDAAGVTRRMNGALIGLGAALLIPGVNLIAGLYGFLAGIIGGIGRGDPYNGNYNLPTPFKARLHEYFKADGTEGEALKNFAPPVPGRQYNGHRGRNPWGDSPTARTTLYRDPCTPDETPEWEYLGFYGYQDGDDPNREICESGPYYPPLPFKEERKPWGEDYKLDGKSWLAIRVDAALV